VHRRLAAQDLFECDARREATVLFVGELAGDAVEVETAVGVGVFLKSEVAAEAVLGCVEGDA
jgi:hypothetical protein